MEQELLHKVSHILKVTHYICGLLLVNFHARVVENSSTLLSISLACSLMSDIGRVSFFVSSSSASARVLISGLVCFSGVALTLGFLKVDSSALFLGFCVFKGCKTILAFVASGVCPRDAILYYSVGV